MIDLINDDCFTYLKTIPDNSIDLIISDVPYGMNYVSNRRKERFDAIKNDDCLEWFPSFANECYRILKDNTHIYIFSNDSSLSFFQYHLAASGFKVKKALVWIKNNHSSGDLLGDYANRTEFIVYAMKGRRLLNGKRDENTLFYNKVPPRFHPTEKPVDLLSFLIKKSSLEGELVLDAFMGAGSTGLACLDTNRNFIGIEIDKTYFESAKQRITTFKKV